MEAAENSYLEQASWQVDILRSSIGKTDPLNFLSIFPQMLDRQLGNSAPRRSVALVLSRTVPMKMFSLATINS
jgi:hypothetical protein